jgi:hypothetical protein
MRRTLVLLVLLAGGALAAVPAAAKEGVRAKLDAPVALGAARGETLRVSWHLVDADGRPFGASGIYLRVSRCGRSPLRIPATERAAGGYTVRFKVPKGGIRKLVVGLEGWRTIGDRTERADAFFAFDPPLRRRCP